VTQFTSYSRPLMKEGENKVIDEDLVQVVGNCRKMKSKDIPYVMELLNTAVRKYQVKPIVFQTEEEVARILLPAAGSHSFVQAFVVADFDTDEPHDFFAFNKIAMNGQESTCREMYKITGKNDLMCLTKLALAKAQKEGYLEYLCSDAMENYTVLL
jgi:hypothetical protein